MKHEKKRRKEGSEAGSATASTLIKPDITPRIPPSDWKTCFIQKVHSINIGYSRYYQAQFRIIKYRNSTKYNAMK